MAENGVSNCKIERNFNGGPGELVVIWYLVREVSLFMVMGAVNNLTPVNHIILASFYTTC